MGPNGSGKTTLIRCLLGLTRVDRGTGQVLGMDFRRRQLDIRRSVGFVPEDECLFPHVVGVEFVTYAGELVGMSTKDAMQRSHEVLDYVGLDTTLYIADILFDEFKDPRFAAPTLLRQMVAAGWLGRKTNRGFYDYSAGEQPPSSG